MDSPPADDARAPTRGRSARVLGRWARRGLARWRPILLAVLLVGATTFCGGYFYVVYHPDLQTDNAVARQVIAAASDGAVALLSYSPATLDRDLANARSKLSESYLAYYQRFADQIVSPSAQRGQVSTAATVVRAAVTELRPNSAVVLVFVKQKTTSKDRPQPVVTSSSVRVAMTKVNGSWLIEKFESA